MVENAICVIKTFKILNGVFRHWRGGKGQIKGDDVLTICVTLANRRIKENKLRGENWVASDWREMFELLAPNSPYTSEDTSFDVEMECQ